jgi:ubiquinone biosynthesis protein UbiJ
VLQQFATEAAIRGLNHMLRQESHARASLVALAGRTARIEAGPFALQFAIAADGSIAASDASPQVTIGIDPRALATGLTDPARILRDAHICGDAEFAQVLSQVAERIRPDLEEDLSRVVGDAAAVRIAAALRAVRRQAADTGARAAREVADYLAGERPWLASRGPFQRFAAEVNELAQATERLVDRASRLR